MRAQLDLLLRETLSGLLGENGSLRPEDLEPQLERTRDPKHGDFTTNIALRIAKQLGESPRDLAARIVTAFPSTGLIAATDIAGPGFINFTLAPAAYENELREILTRAHAYGTSTIGAGQRVLLEYLSANPTGPLHVGHGRLAAYGASLANLLRATGHDVFEEYYVNDAGRQMDILTVSVWLRYSALAGAPLDFPKSAYQGSYVSDIAAALHESHGEALTADPEPVARVLSDTDAAADELLDKLIAAVRAGLGDDRFEAVLTAALNSVLADIRDDLAGFGVEHQNWYFERSLVDGPIDRALEVLESRGMLYENDGAVWFRASDFGDEKDRVVVRENGVKTYFASDIAYHLDKRERGFDLLLDVLGSDHHGYVARVRAGLEAMGEPPDCLEVRLVQFVALFRGREKVQMSTRSGNFVTLRELREEVGDDAARFFYVSRSNDQHLDFDLELAKTQSNDNPIYYIQYAHARVASLLRKLGWGEESAARLASVDLSLLKEDEERSLMVALSRYPELIQLASQNRAPQHLVHYLRDTAAAFHASYNSHRVLVDDAALRDARTALAVATQQVTRNGLSLLGVSAPDTM
ncbi:MAG TPA: arginine--tRNA ligase [Gammaproteobacteria bacterium]